MVRVRTPASGAVGGHAVAAVSTERPPSWSKVTHHLTPLNTESVVRVTRVKPHGALKEAGQMRSRAEAQRVQGVWSGHHLSARAATQHVHARSVEAPTSVSTDNNAINAKRVEGVASVSTDGNALGVRSVQELHDMRKPV